MIDFPTIGIDHAGTDFNDFHFCHWPSALFGGGLQIYHQPVGHIELQFPNP
jgi:hypothetical protein